MLNVRGKKCLFISTPKGKNYLYDYFLKGKTNKNWKSLRFSTYDSPLANAELINMFKETLPTKLFQQEVEAEFVDNSSVFNNINEVLCLEEYNEPIPGETYYGGIDIGLINDASVLSILNGSGDLIKYYRWENIEAPDLINEIENISKKWGFTKLLIENNNQGLTIYQELRRRIDIQQFNTNSKTKPEIINRLIHLFNMKEIRLVKDEYLRIELEAFIFKQNNHGNLKFMADNGFHDDLIMSLAIARFGYEEGSGDIEVWTFDLG